MWQKEKEEVSYRSENNITTHILKEREKEWKSLSYNARSYTHTHIE